MVIGQCAWSGHTPLDQYRTNYGAQAHFRPKFAIPAEQNTRLKIKRCRRAHYTTLVMLGKSMPGHYSL